MKTIAILIFDGAEEMDFVGPLEVLAAACDAESEWRVVTVAETLKPVTCEKSMRVLPDLTYAQAVEAEVVVIPGGSGARREIDNEATIQWLEKVEPNCLWMTSVCTGAFLLAGSGIANGRKITTHHRFTERLKDLGGAEVVEGVRFLRDGNLVSAGGVMSGIEMSLWLVEQLWGTTRAAEVKDYIAYDFPPRDSAVLGN